MQKIKIALIITMVTYLWACNSNSGKTTNANQADKINSEFSRFLEDYYQEGLIINPFAATRQGDNRYNNIFPNFLSDEYINKVKTYYSSYLERLNQFDDNILSESEKTSKEILKWECEIKLESLSFRDDLFPIDQMWTLNLSIGQLASGAGSQPFKTVEDYKNWLERLDGYLLWLSSAQTRMQEGIDNDFVLPKALILKVIPQLEEMANTDLEQHTFYLPVKNFPESFSEEDKKFLTEAYASKISGEIIPAYKNLHQFVSTVYLDAGRESSGISSIPNGKTKYEYRIKKYTTTNLTAEEVYQIGLNEVERIRSEMEAVKNKVGFTGELSSFFEYVRNNKELMPYTDPQQVIDNFNAIHTRMQPKLEELFDHKPKAGFEVRRTEAFREKSSSAQYSSASKDGSRPGIFYVPIPDVTKYNVFSDEALFLHEAIPGHHYQSSLTQENENLPQFRRNLWYSAYGEGWALYTESLGKELGLYTDPYQYFGMLNMEIHRAIRLVVDVGIHAKGWTREKAIQYSLENDAESEAAIIAEIERYMANPGQALSYKIGQIKIRELRARAEKEMGDNFDIRQFHDQILKGGCMPLAILEDKIESWVVANK